MGRNQLPRPTRQDLGDSTFTFISDFLLIVQSCGKIHLESSHFPSPAPPPHRFQPPQSSWTLQPPPNWCPFCYLEALYGLLMEAARETHSEHVGAPHPSAQSLRQLLIVLRTSAQPLQRAHRPRSHGLSPCSLRGVLCSHSASLWTLPFLPWACCVPSMGLHSCRCLHNQVPDLLSEMDK